MREAATILDEKKPPLAEEPAIPRPALVLTGDTAVLQRRLAFAWDEIARLTQQLRTAREAPLAGTAGSGIIIGALNKELDGVRDALRERDNLLDAAEGEIRRLRGDIAARDSTLEMLTAQLERQEAELAALKQQVVERDTTLAGLQRDQKGKANALDTFKLRLKRSEQELTEARAQAASLAAKYQELLDQTGSTLIVKSRAQVAAELAEPPAHPTGSLVAGLSWASVVMAVVGLTLWLWSPWDGTPTPHRLVVGGPSPGWVPAPTAVPASTVSAAGPLLPGASLAASPPLPRTVRDRLRDGSPGPAMIPVPGGKLAMGERGNLPTDDEWPVHEVRIAPFLAGAYEVSFEEYDRYVRATGARAPNDYGKGRGRQPVVDVNWGEARAYAKWLAAETGRPYRLPSEAEWEYLARAGSGGPYWWGYEPGVARAVCFDCGSAWDRRSPAPVGSFAANPFGLHDTAGNVMEWVEDCYLPSYRGAPADGSPRRDEACVQRVARGGSFNRPARSMRSTARTPLAPDSRLEGLGFRLAVGWVERSETHPTRSVSIDNRDGGLQ